MLIFGTYDSSYYWCWIKVPVLGIYIGSWYWLVHKLGMKLTLEYALNINKNNMFFQKHMYFGLMFQVSWQTIIKGSVLLFN